MIRYQKDTDNIVTLILDMKGRSVNVINHAISQAFIPLLEHLKQEKERGALRGVIITSAKKTFLAGGDLEALYRAEDPTEIFKEIEALKRVFRDLERPGVPVVAAINGTALGTGFELALACHHRIVLDNPKIKLGHPEVTLGLMPGTGGVIRLLWLLGLQRAFPVLEGGRAYQPAEALEVGLIDELAENEQVMLERAKDWILAKKEGRRKWDTEAGSIPDDLNNPIQLSRAIQELAAGIMEKYQGNYPAPQAILNTMAAGRQVDFDTALRIESRYFANLLVQPATKNMIKTFWFDSRSIWNGLNRPKGFGKFRPKKVGIIGAGVMGSGIALACLWQGLEVVVKDVSKFIAERARDYVRNQLQAKVDEGSLSEAEKNKLLKRISTADHSKDFATCDLVIEAVFENPNVKIKVTKEAEEYMDEYSLFATNTVSIPITQLGESTLRPGNYIGLHFFNPVEEVPLVEIVRGKNTSDESVARAFDFVKLLRKTPIIVKDDWGFYAGRVRNTYVLEGITLLQEGYPPALIENLGIQAGMRQGALSFSDELSLALVLKYEQQAADHYGPRYIQHPAVAVLETMINQLERKEFYERPETGPAYLWPGLAEHFPVTREESPVKEIIDRLLMAQVLEAVWCLQEKVIASIAEANLGSIHGWGFPAFKGGVIQYIPDYGYDAFLDRCQELEQKHGPRFKAPAFIRKNRDQILEK